MALPVAAVVFDLDGTLFDTEPLYRAAFTQAAAALGYPIPHEVYATLVGLPSPARGAVLHRHFGPAFPWAACLRDYYRRRARLLSGGAALKPGALELLAWLEARRIPRAIATCSARRTTLGHLRRAGLAHRFDAVVTRDDVARSKPHPDPFLRAAGALRAAPASCLALEDSHHGVRAAHAAGMMPVMVPDTLPPTEEIRGKCVAVAADLHQVRAMLEA